MLEIRRYPDPVLLQRCDVITRFDHRLKRFVDEMFELMYQSAGVGLAAPQVGVTKRLFIVNCEFEEKGADGELVLINPEILEKRNLKIMQEGCLSFPGIFAEVERADWVRIRYQDLEGEWHEEVAEGLQAQAFQHELDHLEGKVFIHYLRPEQLQRIQKDIETLKKEFKANAQKPKRLSPFLENL